MGLVANDLTAWNFTHQNLTNTVFSASTLTNTIFTDAIVNGTNFSKTTAHGFIASQLYSTASYSHKDLSRIQLVQDDLTTWNLAGQNLTEANFAGSILSHTNFAGADLRGAIGWNPGVTTLTHNTIQPDGFIAGLVLLPDEELIIRNYPLAITVSELATFTPTGILQFELHPDWTSQIQLDPGLTPSLGGILDLEFADGVDPSTLLGRTFHLFAWSDTLLSDNQFSALTSTPNLTWDHTHLYTTGEVTLVSVPEPASLAFFTLAAPALLRRKFRRRVS